LANKIIDDLYELFGKYENISNPIGDSVKPEPVQNIYNLNVGENPGNIIIGNDNTANSPVKKQETPRPIAPPKTDVTEKSAEKSSQTLKPEHKVAIIVAIIGLIGTLLAALIGILPHFLNLPAPTRTPTSTSTITITPRNTTGIPTGTFIAPGIVTVTPWPDEITDPKGVTMRLVPAGEFTMGSNDHLNDEKPAHKIYLDNFYIDIYEVTNALYKTCVDAKFCSPPANINSSTRENYYNNLTFDNYPVIAIDWNQANTYCEWRGARLPIEPEWEKAARGGLEKKTYPWGDEKPICHYGEINGARFNDGGQCNAIDAVQVGSYKPNNYGLYDMAGNVWEWSADWYEPYPNNTISDSNYTETYRVLRGGSWNNSPDYLRVSYRYPWIPAFISNHIGFRCVR